MARYGTVQRWVVLGVMVTSVLASLATASPGLAPTVAADSAVEIDAVTGKVRRVVRTGPDPLLLTAAGGRVWTLNLGDATLSRIDPTTGRSAVTGPGDAVGIAPAGRDLWVAARGNRLLRLSGRSGRVLRTLRVASRPIFEPRDAGWVVAGHGSLWLTVPDLQNAGAPHTLWRIDPRTGRTVARMKLPPNPLTPVLSGRYLWLVALDGGDTVTRVDTRSNRARAVRVGSLPIAVTTGAGSLWVGLYGEDVVVRADATTGRPVARIPVEGTIRGATFGGGRVWVTTETGVSAIDPERNRVARTVTLTEPIRDSGPIGIAYLDGSVWVSVE